MRTHTEYNGHIIAVYKRITTPKGWFEYLVTKDGEPVKRGQMRGTNRDVLSHLKWSVDHSQNEVAK